MQPSFEGSCLALTSSPTIHFWMRQTSTIYNNLGSPNWFTSQGGFQYQAFFMGLGCHRMPQDATAMAAMAVVDLQRTLSRRLGFGSDAAAALADGTVELPWESPGHREPRDSQRSRFNQSPAYCGTLWCINCTDC